MEIRDKNGLTEKEFLEQYRPGDYERPSVAVDMVIFTASECKEDNYRKLPEKRLQILLIKRGGHPYINTWALPGGFVEPDETTEQAAKRELLEETGVENIYLEQLYTFSEPKRDPRMWVMSCSYMALVDSEKISVSAGDDAKSADWFDVSLRKKSSDVTKKSDGFVSVTDYELELRKDGEVLSAVIRLTKTRTSSGLDSRYDIVESDGLAFDHARIITFAVLRLRGKVTYTDIALNLLPEYFTLTELQQIYEIILDRELLKAPFRRKYGILAEKTDNYSKDAGHRPSQLFKKKWFTE